MPDSATIAAAAAKDFNNFMTFLLKGCRDARKTSNLYATPLTQEIVYQSKTYDQIDLHDKNEGVKTFDTFGQLSTGTQGWKCPAIATPGPARAVASGWPVGVTGMGRKECFELPSESRRLVAPEPGIVGAKVQEFEQLALELVAGRHKALVFSQQPGQRQSRRPGPGQADRRRRTGALLR